MKNVNRVSYDFILTLTHSLVSSGHLALDLWLSLHTSLFHLSSLSAVFFLEVKVMQVNLYMNLWWMCPGDLRAPVARVCSLLHDFIWSDRTRTARVFDLSRVFHDKQRNVLKPTSFMGVEQDFSFICSTKRNSPLQDYMTFSALCVRSEELRLSSQTWSWFLTHYFGSNCCMSA